MYKNQTLITVLNCLICSTVLIGIFLTTAENSVQAYQPPTQFLGPVYYGEETILKVFDHELPLYDSTPDGNTWAMHYDGAVYPGSDPNYGYDQHIGIDYGLHYKPVLAGASGDVTRAEWANPSDHQDSYGLHIRLAPDDSPNYELIFGHLSVLTVEDGEHVEFNPATRDGIIGISGNTGEIYGAGPCPPVYLNAICGAHLHFEVRRISGNKPVNPYGWIGAFPDPWSVYVQPTRTTMPGTPTLTPGTPTPGGATSYNLWTNYPARPDTPAQYPDGPTIIEPTAPVAVLTIDDNDDEYSTYPAGCKVESSAGGINGGYDYTLTTGFPIFDTDDDCTAIWEITPSGALTPPGKYDVYVHIPGILIPGSLGAWRPYLDGRKTNSHAGHNRGNLHAGWPH